MELVKKTVEAFMVCLKAIHKEKKREFDIQLGQLDSWGGHCLPNAEWQQLISFVKIRNLSWWQIFSRNADHNLDQSYVCLATVPASDENSLCSIKDTIPGVVHCLLFRFTFFLLFFFFMQTHGDMDWFLLKLCFILYLNMGFSRDSLLAATPVFQLILYWTCQNTLVPFKKEQKSEACQLFCS